MTGFNNNVPDDLQADWVSVREAARLLRCTTKHVRHLRQAKRLVSMEYMSRRVFISRDSIAKFLRQAVASAK